MLSLGPLTFAAPWALLPLVLLPFLVPLLRMMPPPARTHVFPAARLLFRLPATGETVARSPWWLLLLRLFLLVLVILGAARPHWGGSPEAGTGPLVLVIDDGWAAAVDWPSRQALTEELLDRAERSGRTVVLATTAPEFPGRTEVSLRVGTAADLRPVAAALAPLAREPDREAAARALETWAGEAAPEKAEVHWLSDGLAGTGDESLAETLSGIGPVTVHLPPPQDLPLRLVADDDSRGLSLRLLRADSGGAETVGVSLRDGGGRVLDTAVASFEPGKSATILALDPPAELLQRVTRIEAHRGSPTAGGVVLTDPADRRPVVGLADFGTASTVTPLLDPTHYLSKALESFAESRRGPPEALLRRPLAMLILPDPPQLETPALEQLEAFMAEGGVLLRFAGPRLADAPTPPLPVALRTGDRFLGGRMSWSRPLTVQPLDGRGPLAGLAVPRDLTVRRQVLALTGPETDSRTWARLQDGTPFVTAERHGRGWLVLVHTSADPAWSDLPLSGFLIDLLERLSRLGRGAFAAAEGRPRPPVALLDGFGRLLPPPPDAPFFDGGAAAPGLYGRDAERIAVNLPAPETAIAALTLPSGMTPAGFATVPATDLAPWLFALALLLAVADATVSLTVLGTTARAATVLAGFLATSNPSLAASPGPAELANVTRLAHVITGDAEVDRTALAGLRGLRFMVLRRTAVELGESVGVDPLRDDLALFPVLYWPVSRSARPLSDAAARRVEAYLRHGGLILFDGRGSLAHDRGAALRRLTGPLRVPRLMPLPAGHVLGRSFYLLHAFPGRLDAGRLWVERPDARLNDGVATVVVGDADWAGAWAVDSALQPLHAVTPGGERQRELAFRFGINLVMVALTGNYKTDQVHLDAILERLGHGR